MLHISWHVFDQKWFSKHSTYLQILLSELNELSFTSPWSQSTLRAPEDLNNVKVQDCKSLMSSKVHLCHWNEEIEAINLLPLLTETLPRKRSKQSTNVIFFSSVEKLQKVAYLMTMMLWFEFCLSTAISIQGQTNVKARRNEKEETIDKEKVLFVNSI